MNCPVCHFMIDGQAKFCPSCGAQINHIHPEPQHNPNQPNGGSAYGQPNPNMGNPNPGQQQYQPGNYCKNCGRPLQMGAAGCMNCGVTAGMGNQFCQTCGSSCSAMSGICNHCGSMLNPPPFNNQMGQAKSKLCAGLLGIFLGGFGVHNFYLGYNDKAVIQLVLSIAGIIFSCIGIGVFIMGAASIWGLVEGIMILTGSIPSDAKGIPLKD